MTETENLVRMAKGQRVRHVRAKEVNRMRQNGWQVAELDSPASKSKDSKAGSGKHEHEEGS